MEYNFGTQLGHGEDKENKNAKNMNVNKEMGIKIKNRTKITIIVCFFKRYANWII